MRSHAPPNWQPGFSSLSVRCPHLALLATVIVTLLATGAAVLLPTAGAASMAVVPTGAATARAAGSCRAATAAQAQRVAALIRTRLLHPNSGLQTPASERVTGAGDESLPQEALHKMWVLTQQESAVPPAAYWTINRDRAPAGITPPTPGQQTVSWTVNQEFDAYLDNSGTGSARVR